MHTFVLGQQNAIYILAGNVFNWKVQQKTVLQIFTIFCQNTPNGVKTNYFIFYVTLRWVITKTLFSHLKLNPIPTREWFVLFKNIYHIFIKMMKD